MKVSVFTVNDCEAALLVADMPDDAAMDLLEDWKHGVDDALSFSLDDGGSTHIAREHIVRIDFDG